MPQISRFKNFYRNKEVQQKLIFIDEYLITLTS